MIGQFEVSDTTRRPTGQRWEMGSDFHWTSDALREPGADDAPWTLPEHELYASATGAVASVLAGLSFSGRLHLPSFYCMEVADALRVHARIAWYRELPDAPGPGLATLDAHEGDAVLVQNLFGRSSRCSWQDWCAEHHGLVVIEDHTHDPLSSWACSSTADYAVASLRKTLPLPLGALLWSPRGHRLPAARRPAHQAGHQRLTAMLLKAAWLQGAPVEKDSYRRLFADGERALSADEAVASGASSADLLTALDVRRLRSARARNVGLFREMLQTSERAGAEEPYWSLLDHGWSEGVPFNAQLLCRSEPVRDAVLAHLISHDVYPAVHWRQGPASSTSGDPCAVDQAGRILTVPLDHRYSALDVSRLVRILNRFTLGSCESSAVTATHRHPRGAQA